MINPVSPRGSWQSKPRIVTWLDKLTSEYFSTVLMSADSSTYRDNARKLTAAIADANGLSVAADLIEESLGVTKKASDAG
jgi:hypothetical protein